MSDRARSAGSPRVLLGVTGSIAAYKSVELLRLLTKQGVSVQVAMTPSAQRFVTALTFEAISGAPVITDMFERASSGTAEIVHVERAHDVDLILVAPASANSMARIAAGMADDALTAIVLASRAPLALAPAMETGMWESPATRENVERLRSRGAVVIGPAAGALASGRAGVGRMVEPEEICAAALALIGPRDLEGETIVVTAGPTWEPIDPVRVLANRSTGSMGIQLAESAAGRGAEVVLVLGPTQLAPPTHPRVRTTRVETAEEMLAAGREALAAATVLIGAAAVGDFRPSTHEAQKLKRSDPRARNLELTENPDVIATLGRALRTQRPDAVVVGFAAETDDVERHARRKLEAKGCDLVIGNLVGKDRGFGPDETQVAAVTAQGPVIPFGPASKRAVSQFVLDQVVRLRKQGQRR